MAKLLAIQVGLPQTRGADSISDESWESGIFKTPVSGAIWMAALNLDGDRQADLKNHGGADKAVLMYAASHYPFWREQYSDAVWTHGAFGENFTVEELTEDNVCIGDIFALGETQVQVSQPRKPCWKLARRNGLKDLTAQAENTGYTGWYVRVLKQGLVEAGMEMTLVQRSNSEWTVRRAADVYNKHRHDADLTLELAACPGLASGWVKKLADRAAKIKS